MSEEAIEDKSKKQPQEIDRNAMIAIVVCILFIFAYLTFEKRQFLIDKNVLILFFAGLGFLFLPSLLRLVRRLKISSFELELSSVESRTFVGEVVQDDAGKYYYIAKDSINRYSLPDIETANILKSYKGILKITKEKLSEFGLLYEMGSAKTADLLRSKKGHVFIVLGNKKYYISSMSPLIDMKRDAEIKDVEDDVLQKIETGR